MNPERILKRLVLPLAGVILFVIVVVAIASGGDDDPELATPTSTTTTALTKDEFIAQADAICGETNLAIEGLASGETADDPELQAAQEHELAQSELDALQSLTAPEEDSALLERYFEASGEVVDGLDRRRLAIEREDDTALVSIDSDLATAREDARTAARRYGFEECGQQGGDAGGDVSTDLPTTTAPTTTTPTVPTTPPATDTNTGGTPTDGGGGGGGGGGGDGGSGGVSP